MNFEECNPNFWYVLAHRSEVISMQSWLNVRKHIVGDKSDIFWDADLTFFRQNNNIMTKCITFSFCSLYFKSSCTIQGGKHTIHDLIWCNHYLQNILVDILRTKVLIFLFWRVFCSTLIIYTIQCTVHRLYTVYCIKFHYTIQPIPYIHITYI